MQLEKVRSNAQVRTEPLWGAFPKSNYGRKFRRYQ